MKISGVPFWNPATGPGNPLATANQSPRIAQLAKTFPRFGSPSEIRRFRFESPPPLALHYRCKIGSESLHMLVIWGSDCLGDSGKEVRGLEIQIRIAVALEHFDSYYAGTEVFRKNPRISRTRTQTESYRFANVCTSFKLLELI